MSYIEANHVEFLLSTLIFLDNRNQVDEWTPTRYLLVSLLSAACLSLVFFYGFLTWKIKNLTESYYRHATVLPIKAMTDEACYDVLADKNMYGNIFQRGFNLVILLKELVTCFMVYFLVKKPKTVVILFFSSQLIITILVFVYPPYMSKP